MGAWQEEESNANGVFFRKGNFRKYMLLGFHLENHSVSIEEYIWRRINVHDALYFSANPPISLDQEDVEFIARKSRELFKEEEDGK